MVQAIIFDCFGVLTSDGWLPFKHKYFGRDPALEARAKDLNRQVDGGLLDYDAFVAEIARMASVETTEAYRQIESNTPQEDLFAYIATELKPHYKIGLLSNAGANWLSELFTPEQLALFDAVALSYETGFLKPDARAYQSIADRLDVEPNACVFIDDQPGFCSAAEVQGMRAIIYENPNQLRGCLQKLLAKQAQ